VRPTETRKYADSTASISLKQRAKDAVRERERNLILEALQANQWNRRRTAETLKISYRTLIYKIRDAGFATRRSKYPAARQNGSLHSAAD
jgi:DNA-binding NtrC family response regulator